MDLISNSLTCIRNANLCRNSTVTLPLLTKTKQLAEILQQEGFIESFTSRGHKELVIQLKYQGQNRKPILTNLKRISKPGRRVYVNHKEIPSLFGGLGVLLVSTSIGLITNKQARKLHLGGEIICSIW